MYVFYTEPEAPGFPFIEKKKSTETTITMTIQPPEYNLFNVENHIV
jgi:hypothetical protein